MALVSSSEQIQVHVHNSVRPCLGPNLSSKQYLPGFEHVASTGLSTSARRARNGVIRASAVTATQKKMKTSPEADVVVKATVSIVKPSAGSRFESNAVDAVIDRFGTRTIAFSDPIKVGVDWVKYFGDTLRGGGTLDMELVSAKLDPESGKERKRVTGKATRSFFKNKVLSATYEAEFSISRDFEEIGAVFVQNNTGKQEVYLKEIVLKGSLSGEAVFTCNSWLKPGDKRIFFTDKSYLPSQTPSGLTELRKKELQDLRGSGVGQREESERIYDYDTYNDLGDPDVHPRLARPVLGGNKDHPYPRRCRTGRPPSVNDRGSESRSKKVYVPRDEGFSDEKERSFQLKSITSGLPGSLKGKENTSFPSFKDIDDLFKGLVSFEVPALFNWDKSALLNDTEFSRQTLAGINPSSIKLVKEWPLKSRLDPAIYGPVESAITTELVLKQMKGFMTIDQAIEEKRLFILDYHDIFLPYVNEVRKLPGTTLYGSRTLFMLNNGGTLEPLAIELTQPACDGKSQWKKVYTPSSALWHLAKAHVLAHDSCHHQLISHWLRTHCCTEPYVIATNRCLSAMHPIYRLLRPHFRYTMAINARARKSLINAGGVIETCFSPGEYSMKISSDIYKEWRFDREGLPADLINRGMAFENPSAPHGLELTIKDYPYANDGLIMWDAIEQWVKSYVNHYYPKPNLWESDTEIKAWWSEIREKGHGDKKDEEGWPALKTLQDLIQILTTIIWVASGHHAAVNFGQYDYAGYFPNRPTTARIEMPEEDTNENPKSLLLKCFPSPAQATTVMAVLRLLSTHADDEEYLGEHQEKPWEQEPAIKEAFEKFSAKLEELKTTIDDSNKKNSLKNRNGDGILPYDLLKPHHIQNKTKKGVPTSISI